MRLFIDDDAKRWNAFGAAYGPGHYWAEHFTESMIALSDYNYTHEFSHIYLDHDGVDGDLIAEWMARHKPHRDAKVIIHSSNYVGAVKMRDTLSAAGYDVEMTSFEELVDS